MRPNTGNLHDELYAALGDISEQKMLRFIEYRELWASCNTWCVPNRSKGNKMGHRKGFEVNVENISWQSCAKEIIHKYRRIPESEKFPLMYLQFYNPHLFCKWVFPHKTRAEKKSYETHHFRFPPKMVELL